MSETPPTNLQPLEARAAEFAAASQSVATLRAYNSDWRHFSEWCRAHGVPALPATPRTVGAYIADLATTSKVATIQRRLCGISAFHRAADATEPTKHKAVRKAMEGIRRALGTAQTQATALLTADLAKMMAHTPAAALRDRALILLGFAGALRRSELVALNVEDVAIGEDGMTITIRRSKTDQAGAGVQVGIVRGRTDMCPVAAVERLISARLDQDGAEFLQQPLFIRQRRPRFMKPRERLSAAAVATIIKKRAAAAGIDPAKVSGHSLRAGFVTQAVLNDVQDQIIMQQSRHKSAAVFQKYVRTGKLFKENASGKLGL